MRTVLSDSKGARKILTILLLLVTSVNVEARIGIAEISFDTPGGHVICDCDPYTDPPVLVGFESSLKNLEKWYFYKKHIVGYGKGYYFIFNEVTTNLQHFENKSTWEEAILNQNLKPSFTRWLEISDSIEALYAIIFLGAFIWIPLILIIFISVITYFYVTKFSKRKLIIAGLLLLTTAIGILYRINVHSF